METQNTTRLRQTVIASPAALLQPDRLKPLVNEYYPNRPSVHPPGV
jgi:hypothetical protein